MRIMRESAARATSEVVSIAVVQHDVNGGAIASSPARFFLFFATRARHPILRTEEFRLGPDYDFIRLKIILTMGKI